MLTEKDLQNIEKYITKELSGDDKKSFEEELKIRPELYEEAKLQRMTQQAIKRLAVQDKEEELRAYLQPFRAELSPVIVSEQSVDKNSFTRIWRNTNFKIAIAASFIGVLVVGGYVYFNAIEDNNGLELSSNQTDIDTVNIQSSDEKKVEIQTDPLALPDIENMPQVAAIDSRYISMYDTYYSDLPASRAISDLPDEINDAISLYRNKEYADALKRLPSQDKLDEILSLYTSEDSILFIRDNYQLYKGLGQLGVEDYKGAIKSLENVSTTTENLSRSSMWYTGLSFMRLGKIEKAIPYFEELSSEIRKSYARDSYLILKEINDGKQSK